MGASDSINEVRDFLFEIGTEELPAAAARSAVDQARSLAEAAFASHNISVEPENLSVWVTPRRIAIFIRDVPAEPAPMEIADRGPKAEAAFDQKGAPTKAAQGFAKAKGIPVEELQVREYEGKKFVFAVKKKFSQPTENIIEDICLQILTGFRFPKTMRWNQERFHFSRPIRWLVAKYGDKAFEFETHGIRCSDTSRGHRFLGDSSVSVGEPSGYAELMRANRVIVDQEERRRLIMEGLATEAAKLGARFIDPAGELEEVIYLVENPIVLAGAYAEEHLRLPDRVLTTCMQSHQRYFPLTVETGALVNSFLYVMNGDPAAAAVITEGNEKVLEGRIEDAEFSFDQDLKTGIEAMVGKLGDVVFHGRLGSLAAKTERLVALAQAIRELLCLDEADRKTAVTAARLAKADQVSIMVQEFADLEGYIGSVYANLEGYPADVCTAIAEQFLPDSAGGAVPSTAAGAVLAIADKVDNIMGAFCVDEVPTGSRDPYGIRRAALGIAVISQRFAFDFDLERLLEVGRNLYEGQQADISREAGISAAAREFIYDRVQNRLTETGTPVEIVEAARTADPAGTLRLEALVQALDGFRFQPAFDDLHTAYFRCSKIAAKAGDEVGGDVDESLFEADAESELFESVTALEPRIGSLVDGRDYPTALAEAAAIRQPVDRFFDDVMVMAEDEKVRRNRLALVVRAAAMLRQLGDPMKVAAAPRNGS